MREPRLFPVALSISECSRALGIPRKTLYAWHRAGLKIYRIGVRKKILVADLVEFIRSNCEELSS